MTAEESTEYGVKVRFSGGQATFRMTDLVSAVELVRLLNESGGPKATLVTRRVITAQYGWEDSR